MSKVKMEENMMNMEQRHLKLLAGYKFVQSELVALKKSTVKKDDNDITDVTDKVVSIIERHSLLNEGVTSKEVYDEFNMVEKNFGEELFPVMNDVSSKSLDFMQ